MATHLRALASSDPPRQQGRRTRGTLLPAAAGCALLLGLALNLRSPGHQQWALTAAVPVAAGPDDLLVFGAGHLGRLVAKEWLVRRPKARVVGVTRTEASHKELRALGIEPRTAGSADLGSFPNMVFSAPPRVGHEGQAAAPGAYVAAVAEALSHWDAGRGGGFVFSSSGGVYAEPEVESRIDEDSPISDSPRVAELLEAEHETREHGGTVLRLAGLYNAVRGPHSYWLQMGAVNGSPEGLINLVHYEDAAGAMVAALDHGEQVRGETFLVGDGVPVSRREIIEAALQTPHFASMPAPKWQESQDEPRRCGKVYDTRRARETFSWTPLYESFTSFMAAQLE